MIDIIIPVFTFLGIFGWGLRYVLKRYYYEPSIKEHLAAEKAKFDPHGPTPVVHPADPRDLDIGELVDADGEFLMHETSIYTPPGRVVLSHKLPYTHMVLIGEPGSGKSTGLTTIVSELLKHPRVDIIFVDGANDPKLHRDIRAAFYAIRKTDIPIHRLGCGKLGAKYNGFIGDWLAIFNRGTKITQIDKFEGNAIFYKSNYELILQLMCKAPPVPPMSLADFARRANHKWLKAAYLSDPRYAKDHLVWGQLENVKEYIGSLSAQINAAAGQLEDLMDEQGMPLEGGSQIFAIDAANIPETAHKLTEFFVEDGKHFMGNRQKKDRKTVFIFDEGVALGVNTLPSFASLARKWDCSVIVATQSVASLGDSINQQERLLSNTTTMICFRTQFPEEISKLAGSREAIHHSRQIRDDTVTEMGNIQMEDKWKIKPNDIKALPTGYAYIVRMGTWVKVKFDMRNTPAPPPEPVYTTPFHGTQISVPSPTMNLE